MRTTVTLDTDVEALVREAMREGDVSFKEVLNEGLRRGLGSRATPAKSPFVPLCFDMGPLLVTASSLNALADDLEDRERVATLAAQR